VNGGRRIASLSPPKGDTPALSMLDEVRDLIRARLDHEPMLSAVEILGPLKTTDAAGFSDKHLRTMQ
jgi:hypothetical protein